MKNKTFRFYFIVTEYLFTMAGLAILGVFIGDRYFPESAYLSPIFGVIGMFIGLIITTSFIVSLIKRENKR